MKIKQITIQIHIIVLNKNYSVMSKAKGITKESYSNYSSPEIATKLNLNNEYTHNTNDFNNSNLIQNMHQRSSYAFNSKPGRLNGLADNNRANSVNQSTDFMDQMDALNNEYNQEQTQNRFDMRSTNQRKFEHNLLLPAKNPRELSKMFNIGKKKFAEMFRNKYKLDKMNFKINRNASSVKKEFTNTEKDNNHQTIDHQANERIEVQDIYSKNATTKLEKTFTCFKKNSSSK